MEENTKLTDLAPSVVRTIVPLIYGFVVAALAKQNIDAGPYEDLITNVVALVVTSVVYAVLRLLEEKGKKWAGYFLGWAKKPTYEATAKVDPASPTGQVAAVEAPAEVGVPVGEPVEVVGAANHAVEAEAMEDK